MELFEESLGLVEHLHRLRNAFRPNDDEQSLADHRPVEEALLEMVNDRQVAVRVMERLAHDVHFLREQAANLFNNEIVIWREPDGSFSLRLFIWTPDSDNFIHDHNSWGLLASWWGNLLVENYLRVDPEAGEERASLRLKEKLVLPPGKTALVRPLNDGIHRVTCEGEIALSISVYARRVADRGYILRFDPETKKVYRVYHRSRRRKEWARQLLEKINA
jgi:predicted metal-dependent enzyme (double-stranded beta helix superfamily)